MHCVFEYAIQGYVDDEDIPPKARKKIALQFDLIIGNEFDGYGETVLGRKGSLVLENEQKAMLFHTSDVDKSLRVVELKKEAKGHACDRGAQGRQERRGVGVPWPPGLAGGRRGLRHRVGALGLLLQAGRRNKARRSPVAMPRPAYTRLC